MSQALLKDPIIVSGPVRTGVGTGILTIDKLTHFTTEQTYTATCIAKTPDTVFAIVGSLDGPVGIATVGTQFFDEDLKIFLTIQQGATVFEVGDQFTLDVENGTDLHQDNIDLYDELPQKNFGEGLKGTLAGDHNVRFDDTAVQAYLFFQALKFKAVAAGANGNNLQVQYLAPVPGTAASLTLQDLTFTAVDTGVSGNGISVEYENFTAALIAERTIQNVRFRAQSGGAAGNNISVQYTTGGTAGAEIVSVVGNAITVQIESGVSTANQIITAVNASAAAFALVQALLFGSSVAQTAPVAQTFLTGGVNGSGEAGFEVVTVVGQAIKVKLQSGVSTATQVKAALDAFPAAAALISTAISGTAGDFQTAPVVPTSLAGGVNGLGEGGPEVVVASNLIRVYFRSGEDTATAVKAAFDAHAPATSLATCALIGNGSEVQLSPVSATNFEGGKTLYFGFNTKELTDSGSFVEGNASVLAQDVHAQGSMLVDKNAEVKGVLALESTTSNKIPNVQRYINTMIQRGKVTVHSTSHAKARYAVGDLILDNSLVITFRDTAVTNTLAAGTYSLTDGQSLYVLLDPTTSKTVDAFVASNVSETLPAFRIATRVGSRLVWFNGAVQNDNEIVRPGGAQDLKAQVFGLVTDGGVVSYSDVTTGLLNWTSNLKLRQIGSTAIVTISAGNVVLADGEVAYVEISDPFATETKSMLKAAIGTYDLGRTDRYWVFARMGSNVYVRNGATLVPGEERTIGEPVSADLYTYIGSSGETDATPDYTNASPSPSAPTFIADDDSLTKAAKLLDMQAKQRRLVSNQDRNKKLIGGASWSWDGTNLSWSDDAYIQIPGLTHDRNAIPGGSIALTEGQVAYVNINRDAGVTDYLTVNVALASALDPTNDNQVVFARMLDGEAVVGTSTFRLVVGESKKLDSDISDQLLYFIGAAHRADGAPAYTSDEIIDDTTPLVPAISQLDARAAIERTISKQDRDIKLIRGGDLTWDAGTGQLSFTAYLYVSVPGIAEDRNRIDFASPITLDADGKVAYITLNRASGAASNRTVTIATIAAYVPTDDTFVVARRVGTSVLVNETLITDGQTTQLGAGGSGNGLPDNLNMTADGTTKVVEVESALTQTGDNVLVTPLNGLPSDFEGAEIDFESGYVTYLNRAGYGNPNTIVESYNPFLPSSTMNAINSDSVGGVVAHASEMLTTPVFKATKAVIGVFRNGTPTGGMILKIVKDNGSGLPSNNPVDILATSTLTQAQMLALTWITNFSDLKAYATFTFANEVITPGGVYHLVFEGDATYKAASNGSGFANYYGFLRNTGTGFNTRAETRNLAGSWTQYATSTPIYEMYGAPYGNETAVAFTRISFAGQASKWAKYTVSLTDTSPNDLVITPGTSFAVAKDDAVAPTYSGVRPIGIVAVQDNGSAGTGTVDNIEQEDIQRFVDVSEVSMTDLEDRVADAEATAAADLAAHAAGTATHGATGAVVGTTNTQTLTNKTLTTPVIAEVVTASNADLQLSPNGTGKIRANKSIDVYGVGSKITFNAQDVDFEEHECGIYVKRGASADTSIRWDASTSKWMIGTVGFGSEIATVTGSHTFTNKTFSGGFYVEEGTVPAASGTKVVIYAKSSTSRLYYKNDSNIEFEIGNLPPIAYNLIEGGDFEASVTGGFGGYDDGATAVPTSGLGGSFGGTLTFDTTTPLRGGSSMVWTPNTQGEGVFYDIIDLPRADRGKVLKLSFDYRPAANMAEGDYVVYVRDMTNARIIQLTPHKLGSAISGQSYRYEGEFQTSTNGANYRFLIHQAVASPPALTIDNFTCSQTQRAYAAPVTDWQAYTPTFQPQGGGALGNGVVSGLWRRVGDSMEIRIQHVHGSTTTGTGVYCWTLPAGYSIDSAKLIGTDHRSPLGTAKGLDAGIAHHGTGIVVHQAPNQLFVMWDVSSSSTIGSGTNTFPWTLGSGDDIGLEARVPIVGWGSSLQVSSETDNRLTAVRASSTASQTLLASYTQNTIKYLTESYDTHSCYDPSTGLFTVPYAGKYRIQGHFQVNGNSGVDHYACVTKNGSIVKQQLFPFGANSSLPYNLWVSDEVDCVAGDTLCIQEIHGSVTSYTTVASNTSNAVLTISRIGGSSQIAATESIYAIYYVALAQTVETAGAGEVINFGTKESDSHGAVSNPTSSWRFTAPSAGLYAVKAKVTLDNSAWGVGNQIYFQLRKNGGSTIVETELQDIETTVAQYVTCKIDTDVYLQAGEYIDVFMDLSANGDKTTMLGGYSRIAVKRVGL